MYTVWILITKMQRKAVKGSVYEEILWLEVHNFDGRGNVSLVDAKIINSSGRHIWFMELRTGERRSILLV